ncbi:lipocalin/fatty-acid binding family protein [Candidatus Halobeggiatoa sp. HSG11]|nr:lipocalin/fatty-acid binding family protein [Candidatus Halobeggiatoa sp. HSG11]
MMNISGTYKRTQEENWDAYLAKLGVNFVVRKALTASPPILEITEVSPGKWKMKTSTTVKSFEDNFEIGKEFEETAFDGRACKTIFTAEGEQILVQSQVAKKSTEKSIKIIREFSDKGVAVQYICEDVVSTQFFERQ